MPRISLVLPKEQLDRLNARIKMNKDTSQGNILRKFIQAYVDGRLVFAGLDVVRISSKDAADLVVETPVRATTPWVKGDLASGPDITPKQYKHLYETINLSGNDFNYKEDIEGYLEWRVDEGKCNIQSIREMMKQYPLDPADPRYPETVKYMEGVK